MKKYFFILLFVISSLNNYAENTDSLFYVGNEIICTEFTDLNDFEFSIFESTTDSLEINLLTEENVNPQISNSELSPGKLSSFWFTFVCAAVGTYTIIGAGAGPVAFGIVYLSSKGDKTEVKKSFWGFVTGTIVGAGIKLIVLNI